MKDIKEFIKNFTNKEINEILNNPSGKIYLIKNVYYFKPDDLTDFSNINIKSQIISQGLPLGFAGKNFKPSIFLLEILSKVSENKIFVNNKAEWLFLCGRDIFKESIIRDCSVNDLVLVQNQYDENIGLGRKLRKGKNIVIKNLFDRGDFLRRER